jgi:hypothetical protein
VVPGSDIGTGRLGRAEIERGSGHTANFAERDLPVVGRQEMIRMYLDLVAVDVAGPGAGEVEIREFIYVLDPTTESPYILWAIGRHGPCSRASRPLTS